MELLPEVELSLAYRELRDSKSRQPEPQLEHAALQCQPYIVKVAHPRVERILLYSEDCMHLSKRCEGIICNLQGNEKHTLCGDRALVLVALPDASLRIWHTQGKLISAHHRAGHWRALESAKCQENGSPTSGGV